MCRSILRRPLNHDVPPVAMIIPVSSLHLDFEIPFSIKRNQGSLEKWLILGLGQGKYESGTSYARKENTAEKNHRDLSTGPRSWHGGALTIQI